MRKSLQINGSVFRFMGRRRLKVKEGTRTFLVCLSLAAGTALLYAPALNFSYVTLDDPLYFDHHINGGFSWAGLGWCLETTRGYLWHPLTWVSHMLDCQLFGPRFGWHHATNVALHILSTMLLFVILRRMTGAFWRSAMVAALFAWHPLHVESVAWLAERKDVLSALFWMLTLWAYLRYAEEKNTTNHGLHGSPSAHLNPSLSVPSVKSVVKSGSSKVFYILALVFFILGLMAKPMLVTLPFVFLLLDWWPLCRIDPGRAGLCRVPSESARMSIPIHGSQSEHQKDAPQRGDKSSVFAQASSFARPTEDRTADRRPAISGLVIEKIPFLILSIVFAVVTMVAARSDVASLTTLPIPQRLGNSVVSYFLYVAKTIWPENMMVLYPYEFHWAAWQIIASGLFVVAVSVTALRLRRTRPYFLLGWLWYFGILFPVIGLVQAGTQRMADRYTYIPSIGLFVIFCWGACDLLSGWRHGKMMLGALGWAVLAACVLVAGKQLQYWQNSDTLFTHNLELTPNNYFAHADRAAYFYNEKQLERAITECRKSIQIEPGYALSHIVLGGALLQQDKPGQAAEQYAIGLQIDPSSEDARLGYANALLVQNLPTEAARQITTVLAADPDDPEAHFLMGQALLQQGDLTGARAQYTKAISLAGRYSDAHFQLAVVLARQGNLKEAVENYRAAKNVPPAAGDFMVLNNLAWILATSPHPEFRDGPKAVELAARARDLDRSQHPVVIGTLAAAYAEAGRFEEAVAAARQAHDLAQAQGDATVAARNLELLEIYRSRRPFHEK
jgi:cytochrome c-type biogenesis protein CcmH/NrfG